MSRPDAKRRGPTTVAWLVLLVVALGALSIGVFAGTEPATPADRVLALSKSIRCPQCRGQSVAESDVTVSREIRRDIARRVEEGQTDEAIRAYYASSFGEDALLTPSSTGLGGVVWLLPVVVVVAGAVGIAAALRRGSASSRAAASEDDQDLVAEALSARGASAEDDDGGR